MSSTWIKSSMCSTWIKERILSMSSMKMSFDDQKKIYFLGVEIARVLRSCNFEKMSNKFKTKTNVLFQWIDGDYVILDTGSIGNYYINKSESSETLDTGKDIFVLWSTIDPEFQHWNDIAITKVLGNPKGLTNVLVDFHKIMALSDKNVWHNLNHSINTDFDLTEEEHFQYSTVIDIDSYDNLKEKFDLLNRSEELTGVIDIRLPILSIIPDYVELYEKILQELKNLQKEM